MYLMLGQLSKITLWNCNQSDIQNKFNNLTQNKLILDQEVQHISGMVDRKYDNMAASIFAIEREVKSSLDSKNDKIVFLNEGVDENLSRL